MSDTHTKPPKCKVMLTSTSASQLARFRIALKDFDRLVRIHRRVHNTHYEPRLQDYVIDHVWLRISEDLLKPEDRSEVGAHPNDKAVEAFLRGTGKYTDEALVTIRYKVPLDEFKKLIWPITTTMLHGYE